MSASPYSGILDPIYLRLENKNGLLRRTCDASMLMEALLDVGEFPLGHSQYDQDLAFSRSRGYRN